MKRRVGATLLVAALLLTSLRICWSGGDCCTRPAARAHSCCDGDASLRVAGCCTGTESAPAVAPALASVAVDHAAATPVAIALEPAGTTRAPAPTLGLVGPGPPETLLVLHTSLLL